MDEELEINNKFIDDFIEKEKKFLISISKENYNDKDFKFYIGWFIYAINEWMKKEYDLQEEFLYYFNNNCNLKTKFLFYITNEEFIEKVKNYLMNSKNNCNN